MSSGRECRSCGREIVFAKSRKSGRSVPLEPLSLLPLNRREKLRTYYRIVGGEAVKLGARPLTGGTDGVFVSHLETCDSPDQFSRRDRVVNDEVKP